MLRHYLLLSLKVLMRRKFFTFISIFGISFTLLVLIVATAMLEHVFAPAAPETRQARTLELNTATMSGPFNRSRSSIGYRLIERYAQDLPGVEALSMYMPGATVASFVNSVKIESSLKRTDAEYWRILDFAFLEGRPFTAEEVDTATLVAVINATTRDRFFAGGPAAGETIEAGGQRFRVVGVVADVSQARDVGFADIWVPYTTSPLRDYRERLIGGFRVLALARSRSDLPRIREEFNDRLTRVDFEGSDEFTTIVAPFETKFGSIARELGDVQNPADQSWRLQLLLGTAALLFTLLPVVNLVNLNASRIMERASEIGVRKAFGASSRTLVGQFLLENVTLTIVGCLVALALAAPVLAALNTSGVIRYAQFEINWRVFAYGVSIAGIFGVMSGVYPAWRMSKLHPAAALQGGERR